MKIARCVLSFGWDAIVKILSSSLEGHTQSGAISRLLHKSDVAKEQLRLHECVWIAVESLQLAAKLCSLVELTSRCDDIVEKLVECACPFEGLVEKILAIQNAGTLGGALKRNLLLNETVNLIQIPQALSIELIL